MKCSALKNEGGAAAIPPLSGKAKRRNARRQSNTYSITSSEPATRTSNAQLCAVRRANWLEDSRLNNQRAQQARTKQSDVPGFIGGIRGKGFLVFSMESSHPTIVTDLSTI